MDMRACAGVFGFDPDDLSKHPYEPNIRLLERWHGFRIGKPVEFLDSDRASLEHSNSKWFRGKIEAIGMATLRSTKTPVILFAIKEEPSGVICKRQVTVCPVVTARSVVGAKGWHGYKRGEWVAFIDFERPPDANKHLYFPWTFGVIQGIGMRVGYRTAEPVITFTIKGTNGFVYTKTHRDIVPIIIKTRRQETC